MASRNCFRATRLNGRDPATLSASCKDPTLYGLTGAAVARRAPLVSTPKSPSLGSPGWATSARPVAGPFGGFAAGALQEGPGTVKRQSEEALGIGIGPV